MFNRSRQWVTDRELNADLAGLGIPAQRRAGTESFKAPLTAGEEVVGRFFFIQRAQAVREGQTLQTYEFLHATFGEYLVARLTVHALRDTAARAAAGTLPLMSAAQDDGLVRSLLGFVPLVARGTILPFVATLLDGPSLPVVQDWLMSALRTAMTRPDHVERPYRPVDKRVDHWMATYSLNLMLLTLAAQQEVRASEIFVETEDPAISMRGAAAQWMAATNGVLWGQVLDTITIRRGWVGNRRDIALTYGLGRSEAVDPFWTCGLPPGIELSAGGGRGYYTTQGHISRSLHLAGGLGDDMLRHALEPLTSWMREPATTFVAHGPTDLESLSHSLLDLWVASSTEVSVAQLAEKYSRAVFAANNAEAPDFNPAARLILRLLRGDAARLDPQDVVSFLRHIVESRFLRNEAGLAALQCLADNANLPITDVRFLASTTLDVLVNVVSSHSPVSGIRVLLRAEELVRDPSGPVGREVRHRLLLAMPRVLSSRLAQHELRADPELLSLFENAVRDLSEPPK
jgi:hypothetical protein